MASHREILKTSRRARRKKYLRRSIVIVFLFLLTLFSVVWYVWNTPTFSLTRLEIFGNETVSTERLTAAINGVLLGKYLGLFNRGVNWFYPRAALPAALRRQFPELSVITASNFSFGTLRIEVKERRPAALWCEGEEGACYFMDNTGLLYSPAPRFSNTPLFTLIGSPLPIPIGNRPLPVAAFESLLNLRGALNRLLQITPDFADQTIDSVSLIKTVDYVFNVRNARQEPRGWRLLVARRDSLAVIGPRLTASFSAPAFIVEYRDSDTVLESIDVRFDRKVFYKFM